MFSCPDAGKMMSRFQKVLEDEIVAAKGEPSENKKSPSPILGSSFQEEAACRGLDLAISCKGV